MIIKADAKEYDQNILLALHATLGQWIGDDVIVQNLREGHAELAEGRLECFEGIDAHPQSRPSASIESFWFNEHGRIVARTIHDTGVMPLYFNRQRSHADMSGIARITLTGMNYAGRLEFMNELVFQDNLLMEEWDKKFGEKNVLGGTDEIVQKYAELMSKYKLNGRFQSLYRNAKKQS